MLLRPARATDARRIAEIHVRAWQSGYAGLMPVDYLASLSVTQSEERWRKSLEAGTAVTLCERDGVGAGWISVGASRDSDAGVHVAELRALNVCPDHWGHGVGRLLCSDALRSLSEASFREITLWVVEGNARAIRCYESLGFALEPGAVQREPAGDAVTTELRYRRRL